MCHGYSSSHCFDLHYVKRKKKGQLFKQPFLQWRITESQLYVFMLMTVSLKLARFTDKKEHKVKAQTERSPIMTEKHKAQMVYEGNYRHRMTLL